MITLHRIACPLINRVYALQRQLQVCIWKITFWFLEAMNRKDQSKTDI